jgi:hypothetical protein
VAEHAPSPRSVVPPPIAPDVNLAWASGGSQAVQSAAVTVQPHVAIIQAYHTAIPQEVRPPLSLSRHARAAATLREMSITPGQVSAYVSENHASYQRWAAARCLPGVMSLEHVAHHIREWLSRPENAGKRGAESSIATDSVPTKGITPVTTAPGSVAGWTPETVLLAFAVEVATGSDVRASGEARRHIEQWAALGYCAEDVAYWYDEVYPRTWHGQKGQLPTLRDLVEGIAHAKHATALKGRDYHLLGDVQRLRAVIAEGQVPDLAQLDPILSYDPAALDRLRAHPRFARAAERLASHKTQADAAQFEANWQAYCTARWGETADRAGDA